jgi:hypothetical protein
VLRIAGPECGGPSSHARKIDQPMAIQSSFGAADVRRTRASLVSRSMAVRRHGQDSVEFGDPVAPRVAWSFCAIVFLCGRLEQMRESAHLRRSQV